MSQALARIEWAKSSLSLIRRSDHRLSSWVPEPDMLRSPTDADSPSVLRRMARGDANAARDCVTQYGGLVYSLAKRMAGGSADLEDAVQEVFIELWKQAGRFDPAVATETTFISMIARRKLIDRYRRSKAQPATEPLADRAAPANAIPAIDLDDELAPVRKVLAQLPDEQRQVLLLAVCDGWTHQQVADQTGLPLGSVKTYIRRGLMFVREQLSAATIGGIS